MDCYNPNACRHISNCSNLLYTRCELNEHHLPLLDMTTNVLGHNESCRILTCCEKILCLSTLTPTLTPSPFVLFNHSKTSDDNDTILFVFSMSFLCFTLLLWCFISAYNRRRFQQIELME